MLLGYFLEAMDDNVYNIMSYKEDKMTAEEEFKAQQKIKDLRNSSVLRQQGLEGKDLECEMRVEKAMIECLEALGIHPIYHKMKGYKKYYAFW